MSKRSKRNIRAKKAKRKTIKLYNKKVRKLGMISTINQEKLIKTLIPLYLKNSRDSAS